MVRENPIYKLSVPVSGFVRCVCSLGCRYDRKITIRPRLFCRALRKELYPADESVTAIHTRCQIILLRTTLDHSGHVGSGMEGGWRWFYISLKPGYSFNVVENYNNILY